jgi:hypothetical protein
MSAAVQKPSRRALEQPYSEGLPGWWTRTRGMSETEKRKCGTLEKAWRDPDFLTLREMMPVDVRQCVLPVAGIVLMVDKFVMKIC